MESILTSIKKLLGIAEECIDYDTDIIIHINTVFSILNQLGVGPSEGYSISDGEAVWSDYLPTANAHRINSVKTYMYIQVKLLFDPPTNSSLIKTYESLIEKFEWRLNVAVEGRNQNG